jgi:hypothetical protein
LCGRSYVLLGSWIWIYAGGFRVFTFERASLYVGFVLSSE